MRVVVPRRVDCSKTKLLAKHGPQKFNGLLPGQTTFGDSNRLQPRLACAVVVTRPPPRVTKMVIFHGTGRLALARYRSFEQRNRSRNTVGVGQPALQVAKPTHRVERPRVAWA